MSEYRRYFVAGATYFFTVVTSQRQRCFADDEACILLRDLMHCCYREYPVTEIAAVVLPDHLHTLWSLPPGDSDYSTRWSWIKGNFTRRWLASGGIETTRRAPRTREGRRGIWQRRFWEHTIRDEADLEAHFDYIHYNPVKHGYVSRPRDWRWSSFRHWVAKKHYDLDWGANYSARELPGGAGE